MFNDYNSRMAMQEYDLRSLEPHKTEEEMQQEYEERQEAMEARAEEMRLDGYR